MNELKLSIQQIYLPIFLITNHIQILYSHQQGNIVNFNDALTRIDRILTNDQSAQETVIKYGDIDPVTVPASPGETLNLKAVILRPPNGWMILYNSSNFTLFGPGMKKPRIASMPPPSNNIIIAPMSTYGFWRLIYPKKGNAGTFFLDKDEARESLKFVQSAFYGLSRIKSWSLITMFEWGRDLFMCFNTGAKTVLVIRLKPSPKSLTATGRYISSFLVNSTDDASVFFMPSYPEPILFFSRSELGSSINYHALRLKDVIGISEQGIWDCEKNGKFPSNFLKLKNYLENLARENWKDTDNCTRDPPLFDYDESISCFDLTRGFTDAEAYFVGARFQLKVLSFILENNDYRCIIRGCGVGQLICSEEKIETEKQDIISTYYNLENFTLTRWTVEKRTEYRLLDCYSFVTCPLCTLYGGFNCRWNATGCIKKDGFKLNVSCYHGVSGIAKSVGAVAGDIEIRVKLAHKLDEEAGEKAIMVIGGKNYSDIEYVEGEFKLITAGSKSLVANLVPEIIIKIVRGPYEIVIPCVIYMDEGILSTSKVLILLGITICILALTGFIITFFIKREKKDSQQPASSLSTSMTPLQTQGSASTSDRSMTEVKEKISPSESSEASQKS